jgi:prolyl-tRNA synthetase
LKDVQASLLNAARRRRDERTADAASLEEAREAAADGFARVPWDAVRDHEGDLGEGGLSIRCLQRSDGSVPVSVGEPDLVAYLARAY